MRKNKDKHNHLIVSDEPDTTFDRPSHVPGVHQGNLGGHDKPHENNPEEEAESRRSTGIAPEDHEPIDPSMPVLPPA